MALGWGIRRHYAFQPFKKSLTMELYVDKLLKPFGRKTDLPYLRNKIFETIKSPKNAKAVTLTDEQIIGAIAAHECFAGQYAYDPYHAYKTDNKERSIFRRVGIAYDEGFISRHIEGDKLYTNAVTIEVAGKKITFIPFNGDWDVWWRDMTYSFARYITRVEKILRKAEKKNKNVYNTAKHMAILIIHGLYHNPAPITQTYKSWEDDFIRCLMPKIEEVRVSIKMLQEVPPSDAGGGDVSGDYLTTELPNPCPTETTDSGPEASFTGTPIKGLAGFSVAGVSFMLSHEGWTDANSRGCIGKFGTAATACNQGSIDRGSVITVGPGLTNSMNSNIKKRLGTNMEIINQRTFSPEQVFQLFALAIQLHAKALDRICPIAKTLGQNVYDMCIDALHGGSGNFEKAGFRNAKTKEDFAQCFLRLPTTSINKSGSIVYLPGLRKRREAQSAICLGKTSEITGSYYNPSKNAQTLVTYVERKT